MDNQDKMSGEEASQQRDQLVKRLLQSTMGTFDIFTIYIGDRLGFYRALADNGWLTPHELASHTRTHERYVREWLEQQTVVGILEVEDPGIEAKSRRFRLPPAHAEVLVERDSLNYLAPLTQIVVGATYPLGSVLKAYRTGGGVSYGDYGVDMREGQAGMNRATFLRVLGTEWLPSISDIHARLQADPPARVADIGCGYGWSSIGIAQAYSKVIVDGYDLDEPSVKRARANAQEAGLSDRVRFHFRDASDPTLAGHYDLVTAFECIHDMSDPVAALRTMLSLAGETGAVLIMDERVGETFTAEEDELEAFMYGFSVLHCLPAGMAEQPSAQTGTVMRPKTLRRYAEDAGFCDVEILPIDNFFFRFYRLKAVCPAEQQN
ncbi:MAG: methyltransferase domain-containing protein [Deltaproteobacteria bacterium]|nr:MAG: methyltransferase domain-containing protein [Deltaproteobacteria bacterium]